MIGDPQVPVECDRCGEVEHFDMTPLATRSWDNRHLAAKMKRAGWRMDGDQATCPDCIALEEAGDA